jgi:glycosyltransferase involved in cell wall biosynthesis
MSVLVMNYEYPPVGGGGGVVCEAIAEGMAARQRIRVITSGFGDLPSREVRNGVEIHRVRVPGRRSLDSASMLSMLWYPAAAARKAAELLRVEPCDVIHGHFAVPTGPASLAVAGMRNLPHVLSLHGGDLYDPSKSTSPHRIPPVRRTVDRVLRGSSAVVATSSNVRSLVYDHYRYKGPVEIIPLGIHVPEIRPASRDELGLPADAFVLITVGRLVRRKAIDVLLAAIAKSGDGGAHLVVVGSGPEMDPLQAKASELGLESRVTFAGHVSEERKWQLLSAADAYASSAMHEGFGLVFLEAMAAGLPVVAFDHGGQVDFLEDGRTGCLLSHGDLAGLASAVAWLMVNREEAERIGMQNRAGVDDYQIGRTIEGYERLFDRVIGAHRDKAGTTSKGSRPHAG